MTPKNEIFTVTIDNIIEQFKKIEDHRMQNKVDHLLIDILVISVCAIIASADGPKAIAEWAKSNEEQLKLYLKLPNGIPSHDTFQRVLEKVKPKAFQECFFDWINGLRDQGTAAREHIAIDGKENRRSKSKIRGVGALHIVSAWATEKGIALGQLATEEKSNEITAIPELLDQIDVAGAVITIDAIATQKKIVKKIIDLDADYVIGLKGNQKSLEATVRSLFDDTDLTSRKVSRFVEEETGHGRKERREYYQMLFPKDHPLLGQWTGLNSVIMTVRTRTSGKGNTTTEKQYYISSLGKNAREAAGYIRGHWGIENSLHWVLDMTFREDESQIRHRILGDNLSWIRRFAITIMKQDSEKESIASKRRRAAWSFEYLMHLLTGTVK